MDIVTASIKELDAKFSAAQLLDTLDGSLELTVLYANGVKPLDAHDPLFTNAVWSNDPVTQPDEEMQDLFVGTVIYDKVHHSSCVLKEDFCYDLKYKGNSARPDLI